MSMSTTSPLKMRVYSGRSDGHGRRYLGKGNTCNRLTGVVSTLLIILAFTFRHHVADKGRFPDTMTEDILGSTEQAPRPAGVLPYITLAAGILTVIVARYFAVC